MPRLLIVANRLPVSVVKRKDGAVRFQESAGGLASGLTAFHRDRGSAWIGWPGIAVERTTGAERREIEERLRTEGCLPVFLSERDVGEYYLGFSNKTIWPLCHYFPSFAVAEKPLYAAYRRVNEAFCDAVTATYRPGDTIWIHDYQLMLLPGLIREQLPDATIGFFLHIPFPAFEVYRLLPWRREIILGLLGADTIGFHTYDYVTHFLESVRRLTGLEHDLGRIALGDRPVRVNAFPMGIDYERFAGAPRDEAVRAEIERIAGAVRGRRLVLSVDRLDYTKGIPQRLDAFDLYLERNPEARERVTLVLVAVPSRTEVERYKVLKQTVEQGVSHVNGKHGTIGWVPIWYLYRSLPFPELAALYVMADVMLVTPLRDGMNLVAKEYVAAKHEGANNCAGRPGNGEGLPADRRAGVLILSEMAGAAKELGPGAIVVNPASVDEIAGALEAALALGEDVKAARLLPIQAHLAQATTARWAERFVEELARTKAIQQALVERRLEGEVRRDLVAAWRRARRRLLLLDYDGTLAAFAPRPEDVPPDDVIEGLLADLAADRRNEVVLVSGRDAAMLERWFGRLDIAIVAEHGFAVRERGAREWRRFHAMGSAWKPLIRPVLERYVAHTPGAFIEEKEHALAWHYRTADPALAPFRASELERSLLRDTSGLKLGILHGNKVIEVREAGIDKGSAVAPWLEDPGFDFILAAGDDATDEDLFGALPAGAFSLKVGMGATRARAFVDGPAEVRALLRELASS